MGNFQPDMSADKWDRSELLTNLRRAGLDCDLRRQHFKNNAPSGNDHAAWKRHTLAVEAAVRLLTED